MFGNLMSALQDPEFMEKLQSMPQEIVDKLNTIDGKLDEIIRLLHPVTTVEQQNSISANLQIGDTAFPGTDGVMSVSPSINPVDPDSYK